MMKYSVIVAVFNRPGELADLLKSLTASSKAIFEVIVVDDGSSETSESVCNEFSKWLPITYYYKPNSGPGPSRNYGAARAEGQFLIFLDSDCSVPRHYFRVVNMAISSGELDAFGGPDREHYSFTPIQKAISYAMTSLLTTGGIRGRHRNAGGTFHPRSFNMGIRRDAFLQLGGFSDLRFGEDIDLSIRMLQAGLRAVLISDAWVYHKRRTDFRKFFKQVFNSGMARIALTMRHPASLRIAHFFPSAFLLYTLFCLAGLATNPLVLYAFAPIGVYLAAIGIDASLHFKSAPLGFLGFIASLIQLTGYGVGFGYGFWRLIVLRKEDTAGAFNKTFYK